MNCRKCHAVLMETDQFCRNCGTAVHVQNEQSAKDASWNAYPKEPGYQEPRNKDQMKYIVLGVVMIVAILSLLTGVIMLGKNKEKDSLYENGLTANAYQVSFKNFILKIPENFVYEEDRSTLLIGDKEGNFMARLEIEQGNFEQIKGNKNQLHLVLQKNGYTATMAVEKKIKGTDFLMMELDYSGQKSLVALAKVDSLYFLTLTMLNRENTIDEGLLEYYIPIIQSIESKMSSNNLSFPNDIDTTGFKDLAK